MRRCALALTFLLPALTAQTLLRDIRQPPPLPARDLIDSKLIDASGGVAWFWRATRNEAIELWRTDGTAVGTALLADLCPGAGSGFAGGWPLGNRLFFSGFDSALFGSRELFVSDGTLAGTQQLTQLGAGANPIQFRALGNLMLFVATTAQHGKELWRSDGTPTGTQLLVDIYPGAFGSDPVPMLVDGGVMYFLAEDGVRGREIWRTDGTAAGTRLFAETVPGFGSATEYDQMVALGGAILFGCDASPLGYELWRSDGTPAGTGVLLDIAPGSSSYPSHFTLLGSQLLFSAFAPASGRELWTTDGTTAGTRLLVEFSPGTAWGDPNELTRVGNRVMFSAQTPTAGAELWSTDGTAAGTTLVRDLRPGTSGSRPRDLAAFGANLLFAADDGASGVEPWFSDGTAAGTRLLRDVAPGVADSFPQKALPLGATAVFFAFDPNVGRELWRTDGTPAGTQLVADLEGTDTGSYPRLVAALGDASYYAATDSAGTTSLWQTDGTPAGTSALPAPSGGSLGELTIDPSGRCFAAASATAIWFVADGSTGASTVTRALWRHDRAAGTTTLAWSSPGGSAGSVALRGEDLVFAALDGNDGRRKLLLFEAAPARVSVLRDYGTAPFDVPAGNALLTTAGSQVFFRGVEAATGVELWTTDGTPAGTRLVRDLHVGSTSVDPQFLTAFGAGVLFATANPPGLWRSDGTIAGTRPISTAMVTGPITVGAGLAMFFADDGPSGSEPWRTDGTTAGTFALGNLMPAAASSGPAAPATWALDTFFFFARDPARGFELWRTDGSIAGTRVVADVNPGPAPGVVWAADQALHPAAQAGSGRNVVFAGASLAQGVELWTSDGTAAGTRRLTDLRAGVASSTPRAFATTGRHITLAADDGALGQELRALDLAMTGAPLAANYGAGCAGLGGVVPRLRSDGLPTLGNAQFAVMLESARGNASAVFLLGANPQRTALGSGCDLWIGNQLANLLTLTDGAGTARLPLPIPATLALVGAEFALQAAVADTAGQWQGLAAFSGGLRLVLGRQ